ncbi:MULTISPECIES: cell division protein FtsL [unclassified Bacillus (in: firmicutes)]|uniref:cell division protein FtsL n=1 Tax=unclassified Bacillus (in: firmicutes) TaxID=185979 RepID=UPI0008E0B2E6|nr:MULTISPECIES: cell division protein FtsL [unclassified Bacillus (in: firmicutes)]SFI60783.1 cell division protein FtsL [Bacillus sp. 71mf]SFS44209.1 cell division protein FtsL [Bacillus sp. 103mf]
MSNLAVKYKKQQIEVQSQAPQQVVQPAVKTKVKRITRLEKLLYVAFIGFLLYACVAFIGNKAALYEADAKVTEIESTRIKQQKENQELQAEKEKLTRYDRIAEIAKKHGLEINANHVKGLN